MMSSVRALGRGVEIFIGNHIKMLFIPKKRTHLLFYYIVLNIFITIQEITGFHAGLTSQLKLIDLK